MSAARTFRAVVERVVEIAPETRSLILRLPAGHGLAFRPGQFLSLSLPLGEKPLVRAYSIASSPEDGERLEICLNRVPGGAGSAYLLGLQPGAEIDASGPWGSFVVADPPPAVSVFVGEGTGVAPIRPMVRDVLRHAGAVEVHLLQAAVAEPLVLWGEEFRDWAARDPRLRYEVLLEGTDDPAHERLHALVERRYVVESADRAAQFFLCGVGGIVNRLRDLLRGAGYERRAVHYEKW